MEGTKNQTKGKTRTKIENAQLKSLIATGKDKSKIQHLLDGKQEEWKPGKRTEYMNKLTRKQASTIFKARTRMLNVKNNYRNNYQNTECRMCKNATETQKHIQEECPQIHWENTLKTTESEIFNTDLQTLREASKKITSIMEQMDKATNKTKPNKPQTNPHQKRNPHSQTKKQDTINTTGEPIN